MQKDIYFLRMAREVSKRSKCASRQVGAVLVQDGSIISEGYNGAPRGVELCQNPDEPCKRREMGCGPGEGLEHCPAVHGEMNAIVQAARNGIQTKGSTLYCYCGRPCKWCMGLIINAGVKAIVCLRLEKEYDELSGVMAKDAGIIIRRHDKGKVDLSEEYLDKLLAPKFVYKV